MHHRATRDSGGSIAARSDFSPMNLRPFIAAAVLLAVSALASLAHCAKVVGAQPRPAEIASQETQRYSNVARMFSQYCGDCHSGEKPRGGVNLQFNNESDARQRAADNDFWTRVADELTSREMPPSRAASTPTDDERKLLIDWINNEVIATRGDAEPNPGPVSIHRLNNREYANTIRDLLYLPADWNAAADFPADERGDGFDTNSDTLTLSPVLVEHYLQAAEKSVGFAFNQNGKDIARD